MRVISFGGQAPAPREPVEVAETDAGAPGHVWDWASDIAPLTPGPRLLDRWEEDAENVLFALGGTGKGMIASHDIAATTRLPEPWAWLVLDYERHASYEWRPRLERFGADLARVMVVQPGDLIWTRDVMAFIADRVSDLQQTFPDAPLGLLVDSVGYACGGDEIEKSRTAIRYWSAVGALWRGTSIHLAHQKADSGSQRPFGSTFWENGARSTLHLAGRGREDRLLSNRKNNNREVFAPVRVPWWGTDPTSLTFAPAKLSVEFIATEILADTPMASADLLEEVNARREQQGQNKTSIGYLRKTLSEGDFDEVEGAWQVRVMRVRTASPEGNSEGNGGVSDEG